MNGLTYYLISTVAGHDKAHKAHQAADLIEQQQARIAELEAKTSCCMGVGNGNGRLFVYGDHDSIKTAQRYILERDELAATVERLKLEQVEVARKAYKQGWNDVWNEDFFDDIDEHNELGQLCANEYANKIKAGEL